VIQMVDRPNTTPIGQDRGSQWRNVVDVKPVTFRHSNENCSMTHSNAKPDTGNYRRLHSRALKLVPCILHFVRLFYLPHTVNCDISVVFGGH